MASPLALRSTALSRCSCFPSTCEGRWPQKFTVKATVLLPVSRSSHDTFSKAIGTFRCSKTVMKSMWLDYLVAEDENKILWVNLKASSDSSIKRLLLWEAWEDVQLGGHPTTPGVTATDMSLLGNRTFKNLERKCCPDTHYTWWDVVFHIKFFDVFIWKKNPKH